MKRMFAAALGLTLVACLGGLGAAPRPQRRSADRAQLQLVRLSSAATTSAGLRQGRPQPPAPRSTTRSMTSRSGPTSSSCSPTARPASSIGVLADQGDRSPTSYRPSAATRSSPWRMRRGERILNAGETARTDGVVPGECRLRPAARRAAPARQSISGGRSPHAATACGAFRPTTIRPTVSRT